jgi:tetratricopeptide (TPR) repeat protein
MAKRNINLANHIRDFVEKARVRMQPFIIAGELNREYIKGNQWKKIDPKNLTIVEKNYPRDVYTERKVFNRMLSIYLTRNGILSDNKPIPGFEPDNGDPSSVTGAVMGNRFIKEFMKQADFDSIYKKVIKSGDTFPMVWIKTGIDWSKGDIIQTQDIKIKKNGSTETKDFVLREGRPFINVVPLYEIFPDNLKIDSVDQIKELVYRTPMQLDYIESRFGYEAQAEAIDAVYTMNRYDLNIYSNDDLYYAYVYEYYKAPDSMYPNGRFVTVINDKVINDGPLPYKNGAYGERVIPFDIVTFQAVDGYLPGITVYGQLIDQQDTYNAVSNRLLEYINRLGIGKKYAWKGSMIENQTPSNKPGTTTWLTRFGKVPVNEQIDRIGQEVLMYLKTIEENMLITAGLSALAAYGQTKSNIRTDGVADKIADSDSNKLTNALQNISEAVIRIIKKVIYLERQRQEILLKDLELEAEDKYIAKYDFSLLNPEELIIVNREFLLRSDQIIEKKMMQATQFGIYSEEAGMSYRSKLEVLDMIQAGYLKDTLNPVERANWAQIQYEHTMLYKDEVLEVQPYEMHEMHVQEHTLELMSPKMMEMKKSKPEEYAKFAEMLNMHLSEHQEFVQERQQEQVYDRAKALM